MQELLSTTRVQSFRTIREEEFFNLIEWMAANVGSVINLTDRIHKSTFNVTSRAAFGKHSRDHEEFISIVLDIAEISLGFELADLFPSFSFLAKISPARPKLQRLKQRAGRIMENIIKEHKEKKSAERSGESGTEEDLVDVLLKFHNNGDLGFSLTTDNLKAVILVRNFIFFMLYIKSLQTETTNRYVFICIYSQIHYLSFPNWKTYIIHDNNI